MPDRRARSDGEGYAAMLRGDLVDWEAFGVLPGIERLRLIVERADHGAVDDCEVAFLWFAFAAVATATEDDDERLELDQTLGELKVELAQRANPGRSPLDDWAALVWDIGARPQLGGGFVLADDQGIVELASVRVEPLHARALYGSVSLNERTAVEIGLVAGGHCIITTLSDGRSGQMAASSRLHQLLRPPTP